MQEAQVCRLCAGGQQFLVLISQSDAVKELILCGIALFAVTAAVLIGYIFTVNQQRSIELQRHHQGIGVDQPIQIPGGLAVLLKEITHQLLLGANIGLAADDGAAESFADILDIVLAGLGHGEIILNGEQNRIHAHNFLHQVHLEVAVLTAGNGDGAVVAVGSVHAAVLVTEFLQFRIPGFPVNGFSLLIVVAGTTYAVFVEGDSGPGIRHDTFGAVFHK